jgi:hypothetical protein
MEALLGPPALRESERGELRLADAGVIGDRNTAGSADADRARAAKESGPRGFTPKGEGCVEALTSAVGVPSPIVVVSSERYCRRWPAAEDGNETAGVPRGDGEEQGKDEASATHDARDDLGGSAVEDRESPAHSPT